MVPPIGFKPLGLICFDFDSVLTPLEIIDELAALNNKRAEVAEITRKAMNGGIDYYTSLIKRVKLLEGLHVNELEKLGRSLPLTNGVNKVIKFIIANRVLPVIISGGFMEVIMVSNEKIGVPLIFANRLESQDGFLTGKLLEPCITNDTKAEVLALLMEKYNIKWDRTAAVCDGANDINLLRKVRHPIGFKCKKTVSKYVKYNCYNDLRETIGFLVTEGFFDFKH